MYVPDNYDAFSAWDADQHRQLAQFPTCEWCDKTIQDDYFYIINDESICEECLRQNFRRSVEEYME